MASIVGWIVRPLLIVTIPFQLYCVYRLGKALGLSTGVLVLCLIAMLLPIVSLGCLVVLNSKATGILRAAGIKVGFMGAKPSDLP